MRVRVFLALVLTVLLAAFVSACDSGGGTTSVGATSTGTTSGGTTTQGPLSQRDFKNKVAAAIITGTDLQGDPGFGLNVDVSEQNGLDTVQLVLADAYKQYTSDPTRQDEIVDGLVQEAVRRMDEGNTKRSFSDVRDQLMPMLKRTVDVSRIEKDPAVRRFDDLDVIYAVQGEHYFTVATKDDLDKMVIAKPLYGTTRTQYTVLWKLWEHDTVAAWHRDRLTRHLRVVDGNSMVKDLVSAGVCDLGWTDTDDFFEARDNGKPVAMLPVRVDSGKTICIPNTVAARAPPASGATM